MRGSRALPGSWCGGLWRDKKVRSAQCAVNSKNAPTCPGGGGAIRLNKCPKTPLARPRSAPVPGRSNIRHPLPSENPTRLHSCRACARDGRTPTEKTHPPSAPVPGRSNIRHLLPSENPARLHSCRGCARDGRTPMEKTPPSSPPSPADSACRTAKTSPTPGTLYCRAGVGAHRPIRPR